MRFPQPLKKGDTIGITAPSFGATTEPYITRFNDAVRQFEALGYRIKAGRTCFMSDGTGISSRPELCARELEEFYLDNDVKAIISCGGGELMCETAGLIDFERIKNAQPKWFMGYSDNTNFILPLVTLCDTAAIYGPCISGFGKPWEQAELDAVKLLTGKDWNINGYPKYQSPEADEQITDPLSPYVLDGDKELVSFISSGNEVHRALPDQTISFEGTLIGGCLDVVKMHCGTHLDGTENFLKNHKDVIWVLEACDCNAMEIRRELWQIKNNGWFKNVKGFLFGRPLNAFKKDCMGLDEYRAVTDILKDFNVPIITDCDIGHISPAMPLIMGSRATVTVCGNDINIKMKEE